MRLALLILLCLLALPAAASASPRQVMSFEAPRELLDDGRRDRTLDELQRFGITQVRQLVYWDDFAPRPGRKRKPRFDASDQFSATHHSRAPTTPPTSAAKTIS